MNSNNNRTNKNVLKTETAQGKIVEAANATINKLTPIKEPELFNLKLVTCIKCFRHWQMKKQYQVWDTSP